MTELPSTLFLLITFVFFAAFEQTISGFGFSLIVMPLATWLLGLAIAAPLIALAGLTLYTINLVRYHRSVNLGEAVRLGAAAAFGVPVGVWGLVNLDPALIKLALGFVLVAYAGYSFLLPALPGIVSQRWALVAGFMTGCLGGAYNTPGPPLIIYGTSRRWARDEFRAVLQSLFFLTGLLAVLSHWFTQHLTTNVWAMYGYAAPALVLGIVAGSLADRYINHQAFRIIVLAMIFALGLSLIWGARW
ncbi:MAG: sulfite exporter TauE/SafE family protein [Chloroflexi bacterium]|nr:sulfite exporter TauE/SafE family protein [Chloroflexota bacterium]